MRKRFAAAALALCMMLSLMPVQAGAANIASGNCGTNLTWTLDSSGVLTISGTGSMDSSPYWKGKDSSITSVVIPSGVSSIGQDAFSNCTNLKKVTIPYNISIGKYAFWNCPLTDIYYGGSRTQWRAKLSSWGIQTGIDRNNPTVHYSKYDITLNPNPQGKDCMVYGEGTYSLNASCTVRASAADKYKFKAWMEGNTKVSTSTSYTFTVTKDRELIAEFYPPCIVTFNGNGASLWAGESPIEVEYGNKVPAFRSLSLSGYTFDGWYSDAAYQNAWDFSTNTVTSDITLYAKWIKNTPPPTPQYTVTFEPNGGTVSPNSMTTGTDGKLASLPIPVYDDCHIYSRWIRYDSGVVFSADTNTVFTKDTTIYAIWNVNHNWDTEIRNETKAPTCTDKGTATYTKTCTRAGCGAEETRKEDLDPLGHAWGPETSTVTTDPTCTTFGERTYTQTCERTGCGATQITKTEPVPMAAHTEEIVPGKAPTCTEAGETDGKKCSVCNTVITAKQPVPALGHKPVDIPDKAPTCGTPGSTGGKECSVCHEVFEQPDVIPATGNHTPGNVIKETTTTSANCTTDGSKEVTYQCTVCGQEFIRTETISSAGHQWVDEDPSVTEPATCKKEGLRTYTQRCTECGLTRTVRTEVIPKLPHQEEDIPAVPATCTTSGSTAGKRCSACGEILEEPKAVPPRHTNIVTVPGKDAGCEDKGLTEGKECTGCGTVIKPQTETAPLGHDWNRGGVETVVKQATCKEEGEKRIEGAVCNRCKASKDAVTEPIPKTDHTWGEWTTVKEPAETEKGSRERECSVCGEKETEEIPASGEKPVESKTFTVTFDSQGGGAVASQIVTSGQKAVKPAGPARSGYTFGGWFKEAGCTNAWSFDTDTVTGNLTLYAKWTEDTKPSESGRSYTVTFHPNGGSGASATRTTGTDGRLGALPGGPSRSGYTFEGWYTASSGGQRVTVNTVFQSDTTVYAHWEQESSSTASRHRIYAPGRVTGGSLSVSHSSAYEDTRITVELDPRNGYELDWISVTNLDTGRELRLTERRWDEYTFLMPGSDVEVELAYYQRSSGGAYFVPTQPQAKSGPTAWYYKDGHIYHFTNGLVPDSSYVSRDMLISVLYNLTDHSLDGDAIIGSETTDSQIWATNNKILPDIHASGLWGVDKFLSREQAAMLIFRYAGYRGCNTSQSTGLTRFTDCGQVRPIAQSAMSWVLAAGVMPEGADSSLAPKDTMTCGQAGGMIYRFLTAPIWLR